MAQRGASVCICARTGGAERQLSLGVWAGLAFNLAGQSPNHGESLRNHHAARSAIHPLASPASWR